MNFDVLRQRIDNVGLQYLRDIEPDEIMDPSLRSLVIEWSNAGYLVMQRAVALRLVTL